MGHIRHDHVLSLSRFLLLTFSHQPTASLASMASNQPVHSVLFDNSAPQGSGGGYYDSPGGGGAGADGLQFYNSSYGDQYTSSSYYAQPPPAASGDMRGPGFDYQSGSFWSAFGTGGFADEPPLLEELGINFDHIKTKVSRRLATRVYTYIRCHGEREKWDVYIYLWISLELDSIESHSSCTRYDHG